MVGIESGILILDVMDQIVYIYMMTKNYVFSINWHLQWNGLICSLIYDTCVHYICFRITKEVVGYIYHRHLTVYTYMYM